MQRQAPAKQADTSPPAQQSAAQAGTPAAAAAVPGAAAAQGAAAAAGKRSWMGPLAGLAAGIGLAALFSHLGMGEGLANFVTILLVAIIAFVAIRWLLRRFGPNAARGNGNTLANGGMQLAGAGAAAGSGGGLSGGSFGASPNQAAPMARTSLADEGSAGGAVGGAGAGALTSAAAAATPMAAAPAVRPALPDGMDPADFVRIAKMVFIRLQAANDAGDTDDLRRFTTPELFASLRADLLERNGSTQHTDVVQLDAEVVDVAKDDGRDVVSVRFSGLVREQRDAGAEAFNEMWHLVRPTSGGDWAIAGITPL